MSASRKRLPEYVGKGMCTIDLDNIPSRRVKRGTRREFEVCEKFRSDIQSVYVA